MPVLKENTHKIQKVVTKLRLKNNDEALRDLIYWRKRPQKERISAVEFYRNQQHGTSQRLHRIVRVIDISLSEFIKNKKATGRQKDLSDLEALGELE